MTAAKKRHYHLIAGTLVFTHKDTLQSRDMNGVLVTEQRQITAKSLGKCQQILQINLYQQNPGMDIAMHDVILHGLFYLGEMTDAEFHAGMDMEDVPAPADLDEIVANAAKSSPH